MVPPCLVFWGGLSVACAFLSRTAASKLIGTSFLFGANLRAGSSELIRISFSFGRLRAFLYRIVASKLLRTSFLFRAELTFLARSS